MNLDLDKTLASSVCPDPSDARSPGVLPIATIIVNYRTPALVCACLDSIFKEPRTRRPLAVVVTDNASGDGSADAVRSHIERHEASDWVHLVALDENGGFAAGNNAGLSFLREQLGIADAHVHLLNPDTYIRPGAISSLCKTFDLDARIGIAGSSLENPDGSRRNAAFRFPSFLTETLAPIPDRLAPNLLRRYNLAQHQLKTVLDVDCVSGASMAIRRELTLQLPSLDDGYFLYFEETDYCLRANRLGWRVVHQPASQVVHLVGQSTGVNAPGAAPTRKPRYWYQSRQRFFRRNHGVLYALATDAASSATRLTSSITRRLAGRTSTPDISTRQVLREWLR